MTILPRVMRETSEGVVPLTLMDAAFERREIFLTGEIDADTATAVIAQLMQLQNESTPAVLYINSPGGEVRSGLAICDAIHGVRCPVRTVCIGTAASMAALIFAAGDMRDILRHGKVMIHDPLMTNLGGSALSVQDMSNQLMKTREEVAEQLAKYTNKSIKEILKKTSPGTWFNAEEAVAFGLADRVIQFLDEEV